MPLAKKILDHQFRTRARGHSRFFKDLPLYTCASRECSKGIYVVGRPLDGLLTTLANKRKLINFMA